MHHTDFRRRVVAGRGRSTEKIKDHLDIGDVDRSQTSSNIIAGVNLEPEVGSSRTWFIKGGLSK